MKRLLLVAISLFLFFIFFYVGTYNVLAHESTLDVEYDDCDATDYVSLTDIGDGYLEKWYELVRNGQERHIAHDSTGITTIRYYISPIGKDSTTTWTTGISNTMSETIINGFISSIEKWNNVYYYVIANDGIYEKRKIVNVIEGTVDNHNLTIYPTISTSFVASTGPISTAVSATSPSGITHNHYANWEIEVSITNFKNMAANDRTHMLNRTGAHEVGHILGLRDIDSVENINPDNYHHEEILMGYSEDGYLTRQSNITYRDIAGVVITRGYHNDTTHKWLYDSSGPRNGEEKLICSICNCVKYVSDLSAYDYDIYGLCGHDPLDLPTTLDENMIPVASYGNTDYYKCKYCRYVAPFTSRVNQNYSFYGEYDSNCHVLYNDVTNLNYKVLEPHNYSVHIAGNIYKCDKCNELSTGSNSYDTIELSCYSKHMSSNKNINPNEAVLYKFNINCAKSYTFESNAAYPIYMTLYDSNFNLITAITPTMSYNNCTGTITEYFNPGTYYLAVSFVNESNSGTITTSYKTTWPSNGIEVYANTSNNMKTHLHATINNKFHSPAYFINSNGPGYYKFSLNAGSNAIYPVGAIRIYTDSNRQNLLSRYSVSGIYSNAFSKYNENEMYVYLPENGTYYVDIVMPNNNYNILTLYIERSDINNFDYTNTLVFQSFTPLFENQSTQNYFEEVTISHRSKFSLEILTSGIVTSSIPVYIFQKVLEPGNEPGVYNYYPVRVSNPNWYITVNGPNPMFNIVLEAGTYYIGYDLNINNVDISFCLRRVVDYDASSLATLITDPALNQGYTLGSEVNFNGGLPLDTTITEGFTRCIYLMFGNYIALPDSRLDYDWYSSNDNLASVTRYGTVLARLVNVDTNVTIYAVLKEDPSVVLSIQLTVLDDIEIDEIEIVSNLSYSYSTQNGTYQLALDNSNSPYPWINYYIWAIDITNDYSNLEVEMNQWGYITSNGTGVAILTANYYLNPRVYLTIYLTITS